MLAPETKLVDFLRPFSDLTSYLKATTVVKNQFSQKLQNVLEVAQSINLLLNSNIPTFEIKNFIIQITTFPATYGFQFITDISIHEQKIFKQATASKLHTKIITPPIDDCIFCESGKKLVVKQIRFAKECILYTLTAIGKF
jgi:hypothetical protein